MDHLHKNHKKKDPYAISPWGHGNDLGDSQLENGKVKEDALLPSLESFQNDQGLGGRILLNRCYF